MAQFWDTHDLTDFESELEEVTEPVFPRETAVTLRLPASDAEAVHALAKTKGVADADLIREWVREKFRAS